MVTRKPSKAREQVTSVERALSILELLASKHQGLSTSAISRSAQLPKSSTSYLLRTLVGRGYVRRDEETGHHTLGIRVLSLGGQAMQGMALREVAKGDSHWHKANASISVLDAKRIDQIAQQRAGLPARPEVPHPHGALISGGTQRFGAPDSAVEEGLTESDLVRLEVLADRLPEAESWQELLAE